MNYFSLTKFIKFYKQQIMSMNSFGEIFKITTWGESHGKAIGVVVDGCPANIPLCEDDINRELAKRRPGYSKFVTPRKEEDKAEILSGVFEGKTTGTPISIIVYNKNVKSEHYSNIKDIFRPGHGDYTYFKKFSHYDYRGGGRASARETVGRVAAGAIAQKILDKNNIKIYTYTVEYGGIKAEKINIFKAEENIFYFADNSKVSKLEFFAEEVKESGDTIGGIVECRICNIPEGIGEPVFDKIEARLAHAILSIGAVKGIEFGKGFEIAKMKGSKSNDTITPDGFETNNSGGMLAGISTGQDIVFKVPIKPIPSISLPQKTIDKYNEEKIIEIKGRHDISAIPRIIPVITAMVRLTLADLILINKLRNFNFI